MATVTQCSSSVKKRKWFLNVLFSVCHAARICEAVQASGPVDPAGRVQMAEKALSHSASDLQRLFQTAWHHRYIFATEQWLPWRTVSTGFVDQLSLNLIHGWRCHLQEHCWNLCDYGKKENMYVYLIMIMVVNTEIMSVSKHTAFKLI